MSPATITKLGFFHFIENYCEPIRELRSALAECGNASPSLIVLPEAFNTGRDYYDAVRGQPAFNCTEFLRELTFVAREHDTTFIAGLLDPPYSSAYLIRSNGQWEIIAHKRSDDGTGNYTACERSCGQNPIPFGGISIGVLICKDVDLSTYAEQMFSQTESGRRVFCVPAWMSNGYFSGDLLGTQFWLGKYVVLANAHKYGCGSFIANTKGTKVAQFGVLGRPEEQCNKLVIMSFAEIDDQKQ